MGWSTLGEALGMLGLEDRHADGQGATAKAAYADYLRANQTPSERMMARVLYHLGIDAEPQVAVRGYVADFLDEASKTIIEVDGSVHASRREADSERTSHLNEAGYRVIRITNDEVIHLMQSVAGAR